MTDALLERAAALRDAPGRAMIGIAGVPGAGKSHLSAAIRRGLDVPGGAGVAVLPMDGFHLPDDVLAARGLLDRKGAPETFDADAFLRLLHNVRRFPDHRWPVPIFERDRGGVLHDAHWIDPRVRLVVVEGNYLLLERPPWSRIRALLDESWFLTVDPALQRTRLVDRQVAGGRSPAQARAWVERSDLANTRVVLAEGARADVVVPGDPSDPDR